MAPGEVAPPMLKEASGDVRLHLVVYLFALDDGVMMLDWVVGDGGANAETVVVNPIAVKIKDENFMVMKIYFNYGE